MPFVALLSRSGDDWSFLLPLNRIASEQHSSAQPPLKLALLQRSVKINVVQKQQSGVRRNDFAYPWQQTSNKNGDLRCGQGLKIIRSAHRRSYSTRLL